MYEDCKWFLDKSRDLWRTFVLKGQLILVCGIVCQIIEGAINSQFMRETWFLHSFQAVRYWDLSKAEFHRKSEYREGIQITPPGVLKNRAFILRGDIDALSCNVCSFWVPRPDRYSLKSTQRPGTRGMASGLWRGFITRPLLNDGISSEMSESPSGRLR